MDQPDSPDDRHRRCPPALLALTALASLTAAAAPVDLTDLSFESLTSMQVSTASRFAQSTREAPSAAAVITREDIRRHGWRTLAEILNSLPGFYAVSDGAYDFAGARGFLIPGDYNSRFLLLLDGLRLNDNIYQQALLGEEFPVDANLIERVEYVPGPGSSIYGGNAIFGVINVITRKPGEMPPLEVNASGALPAAGALQLTGSHRLPSGAAVMASVSRSLRAARDTTYRDPAGGLQMSNGLPSPDGIAHDLDRLETRRAMLRYEDGGLTLTGWYGDRVVNPSSALYLSLFDTPWQEVRDTVWSVSAHYQGAPAKDLQLETHLGYAQSAYNSDSPFLDGANQTYLNHDDSLGSWWSGDVRLFYTGLEGHKLIAGAELQQDRENRQRNHDINAANNPPVDISASSDRHGLYVQDEWAFAGNWRLNAGWRLDHMEDNGSQSSPRLGLIWLADSDTTLKLLAGKAYRPANAYERDYGNGINYLGNPGLQPETIRTLEAVCEQEFSPHSRLSVSAYRYRLDNLITQEALGNGSLQYRNQSRLQTHGAELSWQTRTVSGIRLNTSIAHSRVDARGSQVSFSPAWIVKLRGSLPVFNGQWQLAAESDYHNGADYYWQGGGYRVPAWVGLSLHLSPVQTTPGLSWSLALRNALDRRNQQPASEEIPVPAVPGEKRSVELGVRYAL